MSTAISAQSTGGAEQLEEGFYSRYEWCLNPIQSVEQLLQRIAAELDAYPGLEAEWQREEARINLFLTASAISCTVADYLAPIWSVSRKSGRRSYIRYAVDAAKKLLQYGCFARNLLFENPIRKWQQDWDDCVGLACRILVNQLSANSLEVSRLRSRVTELAGCAMPRSLLNARMQLPSGLRAQDLTHHDVLALADEFARVAGHPERTLAIVGLRTAGLYFAPLVKTRLQERGWKANSWVSIRPKKGLSLWESQYLSGLARRQAHQAHVVIVDDHPDTGTTLRLTIELLEKFGVRRHDITVLVPSHAAQKDPAALTGGYRDVRLVTLPADQAFKSQLLDCRALEPVLNEYFGGNISLVDDPEANRACGLGERQRADFHVHLKRVFRVQGSGMNKALSGRRILAKSVGWGWLGYHAYFAGTRLDGIVPRVIGLRQGILFSEWAEPARREPAASALPATVATYVAERTRQLGLGEDPCFDQPHYGATGWDVMTSVLSGAYGRYLRPLKRRALRSDLRRYVTPVPTFLDGQMKLEEWLDVGTRILKVDYAHHGFGNPSPNIVDPAYDLASAVFQLGFSPAAERELLQQYTERTGDSKVEERMILYKLVRGYLAMEFARYQSQSAVSEEHRRTQQADYLAARNFLTFAMSRFCGRRFAGTKPARWSDRLFFLDLDGVLDRDCFFFPHTTACGLASLELLKRNQYSVVVNTGRDVEHARRYCSDYALSGGIAEYGCVFVDAIRGCEWSLIDEESREQLRNCRAVLAKRSGVFLDPGYSYAIRAYSLEGCRAVALRNELVNECLQSHSRLTFYSSDVDTYIFPAGAGKGAAAWVMGKLGVGREMSAAAGDSEMDAPLLESVGQAYVLANASKQLLCLIRGRGYRFVHQSFQRGLLKAVEELTGDTRRSLLPMATETAGDGVHILDRLLEVADWSWARQTFGRVELPAICEVSAATHQKGHA